MAKDWKTINGKRFFKQAIYSNKIGAKIDAMRRRKKCMRARVIKTDGKYIVYVGTRNRR